MALATTCPQCATSFKVVPDQLKLRRGLVRCGVCQHVFSGIDYLRYVDESRHTEPESPDAPPWRVGGDALQTAFFLPETILAAAHPPNEPAGETPAGDERLASKEPPADGEAGETTLPGELRPAVDGITDADLLGFSIDTASSPSRSDEPVAPMPAEAGEWPGIEIDWNPPAEAAAAPSRGADSGTEPASAPAVTAGELAESRVPGDAAANADDSTGAALEFAADADAGAAADAHDEIESLTATTPPGFVGIGGRDGEPIDTAATAIARTDIGRPEGADRAGHGAGEHAMPKGRGDASVRSTDRDEDESAIDYFSAGPRGVGFVDRHGPLTLAGVALLGLLLGLQWTFAQRSMIAARVPALAPVISAVLSPFGLRLELPRDLESLTIESFELQSSATPGVLAMSALLRNRADHAVSWPSMQLTLTDPANRVLVRKVLGPDDYLRGTGGGEGLPPRAEWPVRLALEAQDVQPAGYSVILFYP